MKIYICQEDSSNKFWRYEETGTSVKIQWGRLGLKGQEQVKDFHSTYQMQDFLEKKVSEKINGGYKEVTPEEYEVLASMAETIGTGCKIDEMVFVRWWKSTTNQLGKLEHLSIKELHKPDVEPLVYARVVGRRRPNEEEPPVIELLIDTDGAYAITTAYKNTYGRHQTIGKGTYDLPLCAVEDVKPGHDYEKLVAAVGQCITKMLL